MPAESQIKWTRFWGASQQAAETLLQRARQMMEQPLTTVTEDGGRTVIQPVRWTMKDIAVFLDTDTASKLARRAAEMEGELQRVDTTLKKEFDAFYDKLKARLPEETNWLVLEKMAEENC